MVRILANGEIVQDDDPRVRRPNQQNQQAARRQGYIRHDEQPNVGPGGHHVQQVSMFDAINQKLLALGIPRFQLAGTTVEPIATVGVVLVFLLMGVRGLLFIGLLFGVSYLSRQQVSAGNSENWLETVEINTVRTGWNQHCITPSTYHPPNQYHPPLPPLMFGVHSLTMIVFDRTLHPVVMALLFLVYVLGGVMWLLPIGMVAWVVYMWRTPNVPCPPIHDNGPTAGLKQSGSKPSLQSAFDKVPHGRLISKLEYYGIQGPTLNWLKAFLTNREQTVVVEGKASAPVKVASGVPQGTVLGPLLFLLYINDLPDQLDSNALATTKIHPYLGVTLTSGLKWGSYWVTQYKLPR
ncbi:hypothetical protein Bbelb_008220 [Branchiostoma belcheri]|nr:hypothetical protein Bbelb_008220 [Branchiostoma belcheri]